MSALGYKSIRVLRELFERAWHPNLIDVLVWIVCRYSSDKLCFTSGARKGDPSSCHCTDPLRAFDLRSFTFPDPSAVEKDINDHWQYDPDRPEKTVASYHNAGYGWHFHVKVHDNTMLRDKTEELCDV